jgi:hypothetical protein
MGKRPLTQIVPPWCGAKGIAGERFPLEHRTVPSGVSCENLNLRLTLLSVKPLLRFPCGLFGFSPYPGPKAGHDRVERRERE